MAEKVTIAPKSAKVLETIIEMGGHKPGNEVTEQAVADHMGLKVASVRGSLVHGLGKRQGNLATRVKGEADEDGVTPVFVHLSDDAIAGNYEVRQDKPKAKKED